MKYLAKGSALCVLLFTCLIHTNVHAQGTACIWQGRPSDADSPATGLYDLTFVLLDVVANGTNSIITSPRGNLFFRLKQNFFDAQRRSNA
ncbi:MAG: hypothetical protein WCS94_19155 [Verrucomicrobiota bacterium]